MCLCISDVLWFENYDLESIVTPVNAHQLEKLLHESNYDTEKTRFLVNGFRHGFELGYRGPAERQTYCKNKTLKVGNPLTLWNKVMKEVELGRTSGPWEKVQHIVSPIQLAGSQSSDPMENTPSPRGNSLNDHCPKDIRTVEYPLFDKSIGMCLSEGKGCFLFKADAKSSFKQLPLAKDQFNWAWMCCDHPITKKRYYFCEKTVCIGRGRSCYVYMELSNALAHLYKFRTDSKITNFLGDFLGAKLRQEECEANLEALLQICRTINLPMSTEETCNANQITAFLGLLIDTVRQTISVPAEKIEEAKGQLDIFVRSKKVTVHQAQKLIGLLNFFCRAVVPGRAFTRRLCSKIAGPKQHHHIRVDSEMRSDLNVWVTFLDSPDAVCRPFLDFSNVFHADELCYFTGAVLNGEKLGVGGVYESRWFSGTLKLSCLAGIADKLTIQIAELFSVFLSLRLWMSHIQNRRVVLFCNNDSVVHMINRSSSSCRVCMMMIRYITLWSMYHNVRVFATHVRTELNTESDLLSRNEVQRFLEKARWSVNQKPEVLPHQFWPIPFSWFYA